MKIRIYILIITLIALGCNTKNVKNQTKQIEYFYVVYNLECCTELNLDSTRIEYYNELTDSIYTLTYIFKQTFSNDTLKIRLKETEKFQPEYLLNAKTSEINDFVFVSSRKYRIEGQLYNVYKYAKNPFVIDGCITQFWTPEFGIIIKRSSTWRNYSKLQTNNKEINRKIDLLFEVVNQDTEFYNGCTQELELIPKSDAQEFYDRKFKEMNKQ